MGQAVFHRFAIATFDDGADVATAAQSLDRAGIGVNGLTLLAAHRAFEMSAADLTGPLVDTPCQISFAGYPEPISCTPGPIANRLAEWHGNRLAKALDFCGFPRIAEALERAVEQHQLLLWVTVHDADEERRVSLTLLALRPRAYEVHDVAQVSLRGHSWHR